MAGRRVRGSPPLETRRAWADRARDILASHDTVAGMLPAMAVVAVAVVLPARQWPGPALAALAGASVVGAFFAVMWLVVARRRRFPPWTVHAEIGVGNLVVTAVVAITATERVDMANLYLLPATIAVLLLPFHAAVAHIGLAGVCYAALLVFELAAAEAPAVAWLAVFGTIGVVGAVVFGLVSALQLAATVDPLTGLANRRAWDQRVDEEMERSLRAGTALTVVVVDLDGFKDVNDRDGHAAGDHLLQTVARAWQTQVREGGDFLARIGGDEFAVLAPATDQFAIHRLITRLDEVTPAGVSFSAGDATWDRIERAPDLLRRADLAMYESKKLKRPSGPQPYTA